MAVRRRAPGRAGTRQSVGRRIVHGLLLAAGAFIALTILLVLPLRWVPPFTSSFMVQNWFGQQSLSANVDFQWVPRRRISRQAPLAVMAAEDQKFMDHDGFDLDAIGKAWQRNRHGGRIRGGSTISQQVAKNLWLWPGRSWLRKGLEAWFTLWLEWCLPKERILELYLNIAQFGPTVFGVEAAARQYFHRSAATLNASQAARLAAVLPNPVAYRAGRPSGYVIARQRWIERQARNLGDELPQRRWP
ncbi:MAG: monofunctional biosynthetic peptidoglycan transglycosylase [Gammaproteobacteria bacterium PRO9]|nr:monofunctional biosynthetic peptidoglycan transglycosylase [Gammaproteobacteria bacterium PRO9]